MSLISLNDKAVSNFVVFIHIFNSWQQAKTHNLKKYLLNLIILYFRKMQIKMNIEARKIEFIQEFLKLQSEEAISKLEKIIEKGKKHF